MASSFFKKKRMVVSVYFTNGDVIKMSGIKKINLFEKFLIKKGGFLILKGDVGTRYINAENVKGVEICYEL